MRATPASQHTKTTVHCYRARRRCGRRSSSGASAATSPVRAAAPSGAARRRSLPKTPALAKAAAAAPAAGAPAAVALAAIAEPARAACCLRGAALSRRPPCGRGRGGTGRRARGITGRRRPWGRRPRRCSALRRWKGKTQPPLRRPEEWAHGQKLQKNPSEEAEHDCEDEKEVDKKKRKKTAQERGREGESS